jgi:hypothetical protein
MKNEKSGTASCYRYVVVESYPPSPPSAVYLDRILVAF